MKLICLSDMHLLLDNPMCRLDNAHEAQKEKMRFILDYVKKLDGVILQAGDLFDKSRSWVLLSAWAQFFKPYLNDVVMYSVYGQHDTYLYSTSTRHATNMGIGSIFGFPLILSEKPTSFEHGAVNIYGCHYGSNVPEVITRGINVLVIHKEIVPHKLWATQTGSIYAPKFLNEHKEYDLILAGDCHRPFFYASTRGSYIINTGCLIRETADEFQFDRKIGFYIFDTEEKELRWINIPVALADEVLTRKHLESQKRVRIQLDEFISKVKAGTGSNKASFQNNLIAVLDEMKANKEVRSLIAEVTNEGEEKA